MLRYLYLSLMFSVAMLVGPGSATSDDHADLPLPASVTLQLHSTGFESAAGLTFDKSGNLFAVNYRSDGNIGRITPDGQASIWCDLNELAPLEELEVTADCLAADSLGRLIIGDSSGGRLLRLSADGFEIEILADRFQGAKFFTISDITIDPGGNIFFSDPGESNRMNPDGAVYVYNATTLKVSRVVTDLAHPSGLAFFSSVGEKRKSYLCVSESKRNRVLIYEINAQKEAVNGRVLIDFTAEKGESADKLTAFPDGLAFDAKGRLYVALRSHGVINVVETPSGHILRRYDAHGPVAKCQLYSGSLFFSSPDKEAIFRIEINSKEQLSAPSN